MQADLAMHKKSIASFFCRAKRHEDRRLPYFPVFGRRLVEIAQIPPGASVLDAATGGGTVLFPLSERIGRQGRVIGIDRSPGMVEGTNSAIRARGLKKAIVLKMDAEALQFPDASFDHVLCGFAPFLFRSPSRSLSEFRRVLRPAGTLAVTTPGATDPAWDWYDDLRRAYCTALKLSADPLNKVTDLAAALEQAGFTSIQVWTEEMDWVFATEEEWWAATGLVSPDAALEKMDSHILERFKREAFEKMQSIRQPDGFHRRLQANFATGIKPDGERR